MRWLADLIYILAAIAYLPVALFNALWLGKNRTGWSQRFGRINHIRRSSNRVWVHAVSLGEVNATPRLIASLREVLPGIDVAVSTTTDTGYRRATQLYGVENVFRFPLDFSWVVRRALDALDPRMIVLVELEVWPNLVLEAFRRGVPVVVVNGRLTQRSARRLARFGTTMRRVFGRLTWVGAQDEIIGARFKALGVPPAQVEITGSVKWDTAVVADRVEGETDLALALGLDRSQRIWVCGSTGPGEESILLDAYELVVQEMDAPRLALIPRKPERFDEVARLIESRGFCCLRRSHHANGSKPAPQTPRTILLGDTMGELRTFYSLADLVFVGRTLVPMGGSDPMEAAGLGKPILTGPHNENFEQPVRKLHEGGALEIVHSSRELGREVCRLLQDGAALKTMGRRGQEIVLTNRGATEKTVQRLTKLLTGTPIAEAQHASAGLGRSKPQQYNRTLLQAPEKV